MVILTRSAYRRAYESFDSSDISQKNVIPPWCSSGKVYERRKPKKVEPKWEMRSTCPLRENIWEYLYEDSVEQKYNCSYKRRHKRSKHKSVPNESRWFRWLILVLGFAGTLTSNVPTSLVITDCCNRLKYLTEELAKAEQTLRNTLRSRTTMLTVRTSTEAKHIDTRYIEGATASKGSDTTEWGGRVALWGVVPLWRAAPPPDTILAMRRPTLSDCWPFIGSYGEIIIRLAQPQRVSHVTLEHIHPDTARSAPRHFLIYGVLANNTWIKAVDGRYRAEGPPKQYYSLAYNNIEWQTLVFRVLTNQGNKKYTCIYRVHLYGPVDNSLIPFTSNK